MAHGVPADMAMVDAQIVRAMASTDPVRITPWKHSRRFLQYHRGNWDVDCYFWSGGMDLNDILHPFPSPVWANAGSGSVLRFSRQPLLTLLDQP